MGTESKQELKFRDKQNGNTNQGILAPTKEVGKNLKLRQGFKNGFAPCVSLPSFE